ncbi:hypothetical protein FRC02_004241, partial [Tulasnella sp. 418]
MDALAGNIESATKKTQSQISQDSSGRSIGTFNDATIVQTLADDIHMAIEAFNTKHSSKHEEPLKPSTSRAVRVISGRVVSVLKVVKESLDGVPVLGLKGAIGGLVGVLEAINKLVDNEDDLVKLIEHITGLVKIITPAPGSDTDGMDKHLQQRVADLATDINKITEDAVMLQKQNLGSKLVDHSDNASAITGLTRAVDQAIDRFQVAGSLSVERKVVRLEEGTGRVERSIGMVGNRLESVEDKLEQIQVTAISVAEEAALIAIQPRAHNARYDSISQKTPFCLPNTRVALLEEIFRWANDPTAKPLFWLSGMAGTGKTTIARTVARQLDEKGLLGASFFFSRDEEDRRSTARLFPTIAYQLARSKALYRKQIISAADPDACTAMIEKQLKKLVVEPLKTVKKDTTSSPIILVLDALDECANEDQITEMIFLLSTALQDLQPHVDLKVMVTGRPETHIQGQFTRPGMEIVSNISKLHDIEKSIVRGDINLYLSHHLEGICHDMYMSDIAWPHENDVEALTDMADGLFIFASVAVAYIRRKPVERMKILLAGADHQKAPYAFKNLDELYRQVLKSAETALYEDEDDAIEDTKLLNDVLGTIALVLNPLSTRALELLLGLDHGIINPQLEPFHSLLSIQDPPYTVRIFHKSFPDFLLDKRRCGADSWFYIDSKAHHTRLALLCLKHMNSILKQDMCNVGDALNSEITDREGMLNRHVPPHLMYACLHWAYHLELAASNEELEQEVEIFAKSLNVLYWLEILSLAEKLSNGIHLLKSALGWFKTN